MGAITTKREIAFIDRNVDDLGTLLAGMRADVQPILLSDDEPAPRQMARAVQGREGLEAIHVIAHGRPGGVSFGAGALTLDTRGECAREFAEIGRTLRDGVRFNCGPARPHGAVPVRWRVPWNTYAATRLSRESAEHEINRNSLTRKLGNLNHGYDQ